MRYYPRFTADGACKAVCLLTASKSRLNAGRLTYCPAPLTVDSFPSVQTKLPRLIVWAAIPCTVRPSKILKSIFWWCVFAEIVRFPLGSQTTISASAPTEIEPFWGYILNIFAELVDVTATLGSIVYNSYPVTVQIGTGQTIGNVTAGFADDIYILEPVKCLTK